MKIKHLNHYLLCIWFALFVALSVGKINTSLVFWDLGNTKGTINVIPFNFLIQTVKVLIRALQLGSHVSLFDIATMCKNFLLNVLLFVPFGVLLPLIKPMYSMRKIIIHSAVISLAMEVTQLILCSSHLSFRITDIDDIIANVIGAIIGSLILICAQKKFYRDQTTIQ